MTRPYMLADQFDGTRRGKFVGIDSMFLGRTARVRWLSKGLVQAQFERGPTWMTNSWLTFKRSEWELEDSDDDQTGD